ncbi:hypothetical protein GWI33_005921 [Rhynchophorus ferrugineus]|uniref:Uncharacterized protein n=1 Tax=Rhynchophorus ferrugineus TaxID=354439 RepID=A0A834IY65_RHYFE|nr:hypothetical protein GWI33_005921 [Rhynchophorus ferrugineus]
MAIHRLFGSHTHPQPHRCQAPRIRTCIRAESPGLEKVLREVKKSSSFSGGSTTPPFERARVSPFSRSRTKRALSATRSAHAHSYYAGQLLKPSMSKLKSSRPNVGKSRPHVRYTQQIAERLDIHDIQG